MTVSEDCKLVADWMREPDHAEKFTFNDLNDWLDRRPITEVARLTAALSDQAPSPLSEWHEDMGAVLWWKFPIDEAPYVGTPNDIGQIVQVEVQILMRTFVDPDGAGGGSKTVKCDVGGWPGYHTHFTPIPLPAPPRSSTAGESQSG